MLLTCLVVRFELLYSARNADEFAEIERNLADLRDVAVTVSVQRAAMAAMRELAARGEHRVKLSDLLIAAAAQEAGVGVLHCDGDFDLLATALAFESSGCCARRSAGGRRLPGVEQALATPGRGWIGFAPLT